MKYLCIGDSNTYGYDARDFFGGRYAHPWPEILQELTANVCVNLGENGREIPHRDWEIGYIDRQIREELSVEESPVEELPAGELSAAGLLILLGTNDILNLFSEVEETVCGRMDAYLAHLNETFPQTKKVLICPMRILELGDGAAAVSRSLPDRYRELAEKYGAAFIDAGAWNLPIAYDGVHLTEEGHRLFAEHLQKELFDAASVSGTGETR